MAVHRSVKEAVVKDLEKKMVFLAGPRQVGKTTLAKSLRPAAETVYLNYDSTRDRRIILKESWDRQPPLLILDEVHKLRQWKRWLKGVWDTRTGSQRFLVTGSARLDFVRKSGESLAGRYFLHRLHPFTIAELSARIPPQEALEKLLRRGGFPEPFLAESDIEAERWRRGHVDRILREDMIELERVNQIGKIELLIELIAERVGAPISYSSLAEDIQVAPATVKAWIGILEQLYVVFSVRPFSRSISRSLLKEPKIYLYDVGRVPQPGPRLENLVACHLLERVHSLQDLNGQRADLCYIRDKEKREVDFAVAIDRNLREMIEVKTSDDKISPNLIYYSSRFPGTAARQLVKDLYKTRERGGVRVASIADYLTKPAI